MSDSIAPELHAPTVLRVASIHPPVALYAWAVGGVALTFAEAIYRLGARALATLQSGLGPAQWLGLLLSVGLFGYGEGYRALHRRFVPHLLERAQQLCEAPPTAFAALTAPLHVLGLVRCAGSTRVNAWLSVALITLAVLLVRQLPEPWRGVIDAGVAVALSIGLGSLTLGSARALGQLRAR